MIETALKTTSNGHEILKPTEKLSAAGFKEHMSSDFGINAETPSGRISQLKELSVEGFAILLEDINKSLQGSEDSLMNQDEAMIVGNTQTLSPEHRYDVFLKLVESIKQAPADTNPARLADTLAMGTILIHPFHDGNGRTARMLGLMFRDYYDGDDYEVDYDTVTKPRDEVRRKGEPTVNGYVPNFPDGFNQSDPGLVSLYLDALLINDNPNMYSSLYGPTSLKTGL